MSHELERSMSLKNENTPEREELQESESRPEMENKEALAEDGGVSPAEEPAAPENAGEAAEAEVEEAAGGEETAEAGDEEASPEEDSEPAGEKPKKAKKEKVKRDTRKLRYGGMATALTAVVVVVIVLVNVVANILSERFPLNLDLTADKLFTLSEESQEVAEGITKDVEVLVFVQESELESASTDGVGAIFKQLYEALRLYDSYSGGKVKTSYIDLNSDPQLALQYQEYEVEYYDVLFLCGDRYQKTSIVDMFTYDETAYNYYGSIVPQDSMVEQTLASNLMMVTSDVTPEVLFLTGHDEDSYTATGLQSILEVNNYSVTTLDTTGSEEFSEEAVMAVIAAPTRDYSDDEIERLREWLDNDGKLGRQLIVFVNYAADCPNLYEFLEVEYGLEVTNNLVQETDANRVYWRQPSWVYADIGSNDYTVDIVGDRVLTPIARQILMHESTNSQASLYNTALLTYPESARLVRMEDALAEPEEGEEQEAPEAFEADEYPIVGAAMATKWGYDSDNNTISTNVLVFGSNSMAYDNFTSMSTVYNEEFLLGMANGITGNETPVNISNKPLEQTSLEFTAGQMNVFFIVFVAIIPVVILIVCLVVFLRRRRL